MSSKELRNVTVHARQTLGPLLYKGCGVQDIKTLSCPCSSKGLGLIVLYENNSQEMITDKKEIFARVRVRSTPLQGDDCSSIRQGEHVLAAKSSQVDGVFYDARMEKVFAYNFHFKNLFDAWSL